MTKTKKHGSKLKLRPKRMRQTYIPGSETAEQADVREAADELLELKSDAKELKEQIDRASGEVLTRMRKHGLTIYRDASSRLVVEVKERDAQVRVKRERPRKGKAKDRLAEAVAHAVGVNITAAQEVAGRPHDEQNAIVQMVASGEARDVAEAEQKLDAERRETAVAAE